MKKVSRLVALFLLMIGITTSCKKEADKTAPTVNEETKTTETSSQLEIKSERPDGAFSLVLPKKAAITPEYAEKLAEFAYVWGWPMVNMINRRAAITQAPKPSYLNGVLPVAPQGKLAMLNDYITPSETFVTCPNQDVVYGLGFFDLDSQPVVIQVPDFGDRFWVYALYDHRTNQFGQVGKPYGTKPGFYLLVGPKWNGETPKGITEVVKCPTTLANAAAAERAAGAGRPLVVVSDGEADDPEALRDAPRGSRVLVVPPARARDAALVSVEAPRVAAAADTVDVRVTVTADSGGAAAGTVALDLGGRAVATLPLEATPPFGERTVAARVPLAGAAGSTLLRAVVASAGDRDARNDSTTVVLEISSTPAAVFVTSAPDFDSRAMLGVLRGTLALPARAYVRVAPGAWRVEGTLAATTEAEVLRAARAASLLVLHGDTALLGAPRQATRAALALVPTVAPGVAGAAGATGAGGDEWYATAAPPSPLSAALSGVAWDSLPPVEVTTGAPAGDWAGLELRRGRSGERRAAVSGTEAGRRVVTVAASGFWRWQFRGGVAAEAFGGLWGSIFDWLAAGRGDQRAAVPAEGVVRATDPVRWRRGGVDSLVVVALRRRVPTGAPAAAQPNDTARVDSVTLRFTGGANVAESRPLAPGIYDVQAPGGSAVLAVNAARELLPRRPTLRAGSVGSAPAADRTPRLRDLGWVYGLALVLLCLEWLLRRRVGLR